MSRSSCFLFSIEFYMHTHEDQVKWASKRDNAIDLAKKKDPSSLNIATTIDDPWYKCQALSVITTAFEGEMRLKSLSLAMDCIYLLRQEPYAEDSYREVAVSSWLISALIFCNKVENAKALFFDQLSKSSSIRHGGSRAAALDLLFLSIFHIDKNLRLESAIKIINLLSPPTHWRQKRTIIAIIGYLNYEDPKLSSFVANEIIDKEAKKVIEKAILKNQKYFPRKFV